MLSIACLVVMVSSSSGAQNAALATPPNQSIESLLSSGEPRLVAWGAHEALAAGRRDLIPDLLSLAAQWQPLPTPADTWNASDSLPQEELDRRDAMQAVLDALIQLHAPISADVLRTIAPDFQNDAVVLLSRMPINQALPLAWEFYRSAPDKCGPLRGVSARMLALHPPPGFAADLLRNITVLAFIYVVAPGSEPFGAGFGGPDCFVEGSSSPRKDWPMTGQYILRNYSADPSAETQQAAIKLVGGSQPVYAVRKEAKYFRAEYCGTTEGGFLESETSRNLIAEMLGLAPDKVPWEIKPQAHIEFWSPQQFNRKLLAFVATEQAKYRTTVADLVAHGLLTQTEAEQSLPKLQLEISDVRRQENAPAIAKPAILPENVAWSISPF